MNEQPESNAPVLETHEQASGLQRSLGPWMLWGLGVGYVIGGEYFGWNLGLVAGGSIGMLVAFVIVTLLYVTFVFCYCEMACAVPKAGGVFDYAQLGLGKFWAYVSGLAQVLEFLFAPPALAMAVGAYLVPVLPESLNMGPKPLAIAALGLVTILNVRGIKQAAAFELAIAIVASLGLLLFAWLVAPEFETKNYLANPWPNGWFGVFQAVPFAIWFYLGIEGVANVAEESRNPTRDIPRGFGGALFTLIVLAAGVMVLSVGVAGWEPVVYAMSDLTRTADGGWAVAEGAAKSDSPLTLALDQADTSRWGGRVFELMCIFGLVSSLNGLSLASGRAILEMGRAHYLPAVLGKVDPDRKTPANALIFNFLFGTLALLVLDTAKLITWSALGAVMLYVLAIPALIGLRRKHPHLARPFRTPLYPYLPAVAFVLALGCFVAMIIGNMNEPGALAPITELGSVDIEFGLFWVVALLVYVAVVRKIDHPSALPESE
jgi:ethanolamine permease